MKHNYFFKEWRRFRGLKQGPVADATGMSIPSISQIETGKQGFSTESLEALAEVYDCHPGELLMVDPEGMSEQWQLYKDMLTLSPADLEFVRGSINFLKEQKRSASSVSQKPALAQGQP